MDLFPRFRFRPRLLGEARVYDLLTEIDDATGFAVHSVNLPEHEYKRWSEADFVVVSRTGLLLLEVKGGTVSLSGRVWRYENARGQAIESSEGPARQAISAAVALENLLRKRTGRKIRCRWGIVFPLCTFSRQVDELPPERLADLKACCDPVSFQQWLNSIPFDQHSADDFALSDDDINEIKEILLPELSAGSSLGLSSAGVANGVTKLTKQQYAILDSLSANPRISVTGGAGTGKTELAVFCARAELAAGRKPAILAQGAGLLKNLQDRLAGTEITVSDAEIPHGTDVLIVDEGQDFARPEMLNHIFSQLPGGLERGRWRWFMDPNLQYMDIPPDPHAIEMLRENSMSVMLSRNVRSTQEIVRSIQAFLASDIGISVIDGYGVRVGFHEVTNPAQQADSAVELIKGLLEDGISASEIAVLSPLGVSSPVAGVIAEKLVHILRPLRKNGGFTSSSQGVVTGIMDFRGLESRVVILVDLDQLTAEADFERNLYVGMTRSSAVLHLFVPDTVKIKLVALLKKNS